MSGRRRNLEPVPEEFRNGDGHGRGLATKEPRPVPAFPTDAMPKACRALIEDAEKALGCSRDLVALPMLAALAAGIGTTRACRIKKGWTEHAGLFLAVVASPGSMKSPAAKIALSPLYKKQEQLEAEHKKKRDEYDREMREYEVDKRRASKDEMAAPPPPQPPTMKRTVAVDTTVEALVGILANNPRGIAVHRDELTGWLRSMDQYKSGGKGSDRTHWLSMWDNQHLVVDRKSRVDEPIIVGLPFVSLFGGLQPSMIGEFGGSMEDGMMERFLFSYPDIHHVRHSWYEIADEAMTGYRELYEGVAGLKAGEDDDTGKISPKTLTLTQEAKYLVGELIDGTQAETLHLGFPARMEAAWSKLRGYLPRLALVLAVCRCIEDEKALPAEEAIELVDIENAAKLIEYFKAHARRVYGQIGGEEDPQDEFASEIGEFLKSRGGRWSGSAPELMAALAEAGIANLPASTIGLGKTISATAAKSPGFKVEKRRNESERILTLELVTNLPEGSYSEAPENFREESPKTPVILSSGPETPYISGIEHDRENKHLSSDPSSEPPPGETMTDDRCNDNNRSTACHVEQPISKGINGDHDKMTGNPEENSGPVNSGEDQAGTSDEDDDPFGPDTRVR